MKHLHLLPDASSVFIDANIFVLAGGSSSLAESCLELLDRIQQRSIHGFTATFVDAEVFHRAMVNEARERLQLMTARETVEYFQHHPEYIRNLTRHLSIASDISKAGIDILPLTFRDLHTSKAYRRDYGLLTNDSLILAVMRNQKLRHLASHDAGFRDVRGLQLWMPGAAA